MKLNRLAAILISGALALALAGTSYAAEISLLNVSYDPTRELYQEYNTAFAKYWKSKTGDECHYQSFARRVRAQQARSIIDGLEADVATLALGSRH